MHGVDTNTNDVTTDATGHYLGNNVNTGMTTYTFTHPLYQTQTTQVMISDAGNTNLDVVMVAL